MWKGLIEEYRKFLPVTESTPVISLCEGNTPLVRAKNIENFLGGDIEVYLKVEGLNPTGSFKDRGMTVAISKAVEEGCGTVICASTGNTSASAAAYSARAGLNCIVVVPKGKVALGKLSQAVIYGAKIIEIGGNFDQALNMVRLVSERFNIKLVNSINPHRIEGQKTAAFEISDQLGNSPDYLFIPVGNAGNITAYWKGFKEYFSLGIINKLPQMMGIQAEGAAPLVYGRKFENPETVATAIRIGNPVSGEKAKVAVTESGGGFYSVSDEEILKAYRLIAEKEGIFAEPASAASVAGLVKLVKKEKIKEGVVVCVLTGNGLKDPDTAMLKVTEKIEVNDIEELKRVLIKGGM